MNSQLDTLSPLAHINAYLGRCCQWAGMITLLLMMLITITDITTRALYAFSDGAFPWFMKGSVELVSYGLLIALLAGFAGLVEHVQIIVDVLNDFFSPRVEQFIAAIMLLGYAILGAILTFGMIANMGVALEYGEMTQDLRIPLFYIYALSMVFCVLLTIRSSLAAIIAFQAQSHNANSGIGL